MVEFPLAHEAESSNQRPDAAGSFLQRKIQRGFGWALTCLGIVGAVSFFAVGRLRDDAAWVGHTQEVMERLAQIEVGVVRAESGYRGYAMTGDEEFLAAFRQAEQALPPQLKALEVLVADNPAQRERLVALAKAIMEQLSFGQVATEGRRNGDPIRARTLIQNRENRVQDAIDAAFVEMGSAETKLLAGRKKRATHTAIVAECVIIAGFALGLVIVALASTTVHRDFAGRRQAELALLQSENRLAVTLQCIADAVLATDTDGKVTHMNRVAEALTGWTQAEAVGRDVTEIFRVVNSESGAAAAIAEIDGAAANPSDVPNWVLLARDGCKRAIANSAAPIRGQDNQLLGVVRVFRDVTAERTSALKLATAVGHLKQEQARLALIFEAVPVGISFLLTSVTGTRTRLINDAHLRICGLTRAQVDEPDVFERITHPDDRPPTKELRDQLKAGAIRHFSIDKRYIGPAGQVTWVQLSVQRQSHEDGGYDDLSIVVDITERKHAGEELERFFALSLDILCIMRSDGFFKRVSPAIATILGRDVAEILAQPYLDLVHEDDRSNTQHEIERQHASGEPSSKFQNRLQHKDGTWRVLSWHSLPQPGGLLFATARDITDRSKSDREIHNLNQELRDRARQLEIANKELEAFSYSISHDLRAPLRHVHGFVGLLRRELHEHTTDKTKRYLQTIEDAGRDMGTLIDDLLSFAKMGRDAMQDESVDLNASIESVRHDMALVTADRSILWKIAVLPVAQGDPAMIKQVFANLIGNAVKYSRSRNPAQIEIGLAGEEQGRMIIYVRDNGVGFDMKYAQKLFGVFQRLHRVDEFEGTGIGLANVRRIIERHGGRTWAEVEPNAGATFYFTLKQTATTPQTAI